MKKILFIGWLAIGSVAPLFAQDSLSYALGIQISEYFKSMGVEKMVNMTEVEKAMADNYGGKLTMSPQVAQQYVGKVAGEVKAKADAVKMKPAADWMAANGKKPGVITTASGLQYEVIQMGTGPKPTATDKVKTHYHGTLVDGSVFDSSVERGQPIDFPVNGVIQGWQEALQLMPVGSKFRLFVPWQLAYGDRGAGGKIGPYSNLIFEVELLEILK